MTTTTAKKPMKSSLRVDEHGNEKVQCLECLAEGKERFYHRLDVHLSRKHDMTVEDYRAKYPDAPTISAKAAKSAIAAPKDGVADGKVKGNVVARPKKAEPKEPAKKKAKPFVFKSGIKLHLRDDLTDFDKAFVPVFDEQWSVGGKETEKWEAMAAAIDSGENVMDVGPTGCGKTAGIHQLAAILNQPVRRAQMSGGIRVSDFIGSKVVEVDPETKQAITRWQNGILPDAAEKGHWLVLDELDGAPPAILFALHSVLEVDGQLVLTGDGGRVVKIHPHFRIFATANTLGRGDETGMYTGTNVLNEAFLDRFGVVLQSDYPDPKTERAIIVAKTGVEETQAKKMVDVATSVRKALESEDCYCTFSTRRLLAWGKKSVQLKNTTAAAKLTVLNKLNRDDRKFVGDVMQRIFGGGGWK